LSEIVSMGQKWDKMLAHLRRLETNIRFGSMTLANVYLPSVTEERRLPLILFYEEGTGCNVRLRSVFSGSVLQPLKEAAVRTQQRQ